MSKRIIICCDGTWNLPDQMDEGVFAPTNLVKMARAVIPLSSDNKEQIVFYDEGLGANQWGLDKFAAGGMGIGLDKNIENAYRFLMHNYNDDDEIFFFGFSRGAYTVRSTVGLINNSGLLQKIYADKFKVAYKIYRESSRVNPKVINKFKKSLSRKIEIKFIGVWDTVGSLGIPELEINEKEEDKKFDISNVLSNARNRFRNLINEHFEFHNVELSSIVKNAYQALAIDERRAAFKPSLWQKGDDKQTIEQVWFPGVHADVGGGYKDNGLSDIAFLWMKEKAEECGLEFNEKYIEEKITPDITGGKHESKKGFFERFKDYIRPIGKLGVNEAIHPSAKERLENPDIDYKPENLKEYLESGDCKIAEVKNRSKAQ